jgi:hypothetical protein
MIPWSMADRRMRLGSYALVARRIPASAPASPARDRGLTMSDVQIDQPERGPARGR